MTKGPSHPQAEHSVDSGLVYTPHSGIGSARQDTAGNEVLWWFLGQELGGIQLLIFLTFYTPDS